MRGRMHLRSDASAQRNQFGIVREKIDRAIGNDGRDKEGVAYLRRVEHLSRLSRNAGELAIRTYGEQTAATENLSGPHFAGQLLAAASCTRAARQGHHGLAIDDHE